MHAAIRNANIAFAARGNMKIRMSAVYKSVAAHEIQPVQFEMSFVVRGCISVFGQLNSSVLVGLK